MSAMQAESETHGVVQHHSNGFQSSAYTGGHPMMAQQFPQPLGIQMPVSTVSLRPELMLQKNPRRQTSVGVQIPTPVIVSPSPPMSQTNMAASIARRTRVKAQSIR